jgi:hypothetical protein
MLHHSLSGLFITGLASTILLPTAVLAADAEVSLLSATPATPSGDGDWCIGTGRVTLTAHAVDLSTNAEISKGKIVWQFCANVALGGLPKEECKQGGLGRWTGEVISILADDATPSIRPNPQVPIIGVRLQFRPAAGSPYKRDLGPPFNLDRTC